MAEPDPDVVARLQAALATRTDVLEAYLFGSVARGEARANSDVDVAVTLAPGVVANVGFGIAAEISAQLGAALRRDDVDVVILNAAPPLLYHRVLRDGVRLCSTDLRATTVREGNALSRYWDYVPYLRQIEAAHRARIEAGDFGRGPR